MCGYTSKHGTRARSDNAIYFILDHFLVALKQDLLAKTMFLEGLHEETCFRNLILISRPPVGVTTIEILLYRQLYYNENLPLDHQPPPFSFFPPQHASEIPVRPRQPTAIR